MTLSTASQNSDRFSSRPTAHSLPVRREMLRWQWPCPHIRPRRIDIYLPPSLFRNSASAAQRLPVLYINDGQDLPSMRLQKTLGLLYAQHQIREILVVGLHCTSQRLQEYGISGHADYAGRGALAGRYADFILQHLHPHIAHHFPVSSERGGNGFMGFSLGALSAFDIVWQHADIFGLLGAFSGSFWWRGDNSSAQAQQLSRIAHQKVRQSRPAHLPRLWFQAGTLDETADRDGNGVIDVIQDIQELLDELHAKGLRPGIDTEFIVAPNGKHETRTWARHLPDFLRWGYPII